MSDRLQQSLAQATDAIHQRDFTAAISLLNEVAAEEPENAAVWRQLGHAYLEAEKPGDAIDALTRSLQLDPGDATAHCLLGNAYGTTCDLEKATACYRRALEIEPQHPKAEELLIKTESLLESRSHYHAGLKLLYSASADAQDLNQAMRELLQSIVIFEGSPARDNLLECARKIEALRNDWEVRVAVTPELMRWAESCHAGFRGAGLKQWSEAREAYRQALSYRSADAFVHHALGFVLAELGEIDAAASAWLRTLEIDRGYDFTQFGRVRWS
ncbi:MAG TPA: tetratricopeptide repeat protein [Terriglobia bacterium]|nr:tetratricopeptide repeat protein [Terriglobia bacterium]